MHTKLARQRADFPCGNCWTCVSDAAAEQVADYLLLDRRFGSGALCFIKIRDCSSFHFLDEISFPC